MILDIIDKNKAKEDKNGIWISNSHLTKEIKLSNKTWSQIYNFSLNQFIKNRKEFDKDKLDDHVSYIDDTFKFGSKTIYLEIGCGPSYIGEYLLKKYNLTFVGVDFNYQILLTLKKYFELKGFKKFILIHADLNYMPIKNESIDYIYGGGVIEHFSNTNFIVKNLFNSLKKGGVAYNTVPAFNFWWITHFYSNIPSIRFLRPLFEYIQIYLLQYKLLNKFYGYELSFLPWDLYAIHKKNGFDEIEIGPFTFSPSKYKLKYGLLRKLYKKLTNNMLLTPIYYVFAKKL